MDVKLLSVRDIYKRYSKKESAALSSISFDIRVGEVVGLLGNNGSGKTTLMKCIAGLVIPDGGHVVLNGEHVNYKILSQYVAIVLEGTRNIYWRLSARENLIFFSKLQGHGEIGEGFTVEELIDMFCLQDKVDIEAKYLSRGMQQRLAIACAFVRRTPIVLLDEPTLGLDLHSVKQLRQCLESIKARCNKIILLSSHDLRFIDLLCERAIVLNEGCLVVDDFVESLRGRLDSHVYFLKFSQLLSQEQLIQIDTSLKSTGLLIDLELDSMVVAITKEDELYTCIDVLRGVGCCLGSLEQTSNNFEHIYSRLLESL